MIRSRTRKLLPLLLGAVAALTNACVTPTEVKHASRAQLELIDAVDEAVAELNDSLNQFLGSNEERIRQEGRMLIARQAIDVAVPEPSEGQAPQIATADGLFKTHNEQIQLWIDDALAPNDVEAQIERLSGQIRRTEEPIRKTALQIDLNNLRRLKTTLDNKPGSIRSIEQIIQDDLNRQQSTAAQVRELLELLRAQVAFMRFMQDQVDTWLSTDVTLKQEQITALKGTFIAASKKNGTAGGSP